MKNAPDNDNLPILIRHPRLAGHGRRYSTQRYEKQDEKREQHAGRETEDEQKRREHRERVYRYLREIERFERRANGGKKPPRGPAR